MAQTSTSTKPQFTVASQNLAGFAFLETDGTTHVHVQKLAHAIRTTLQTPDILGLQGREDAATLQQIASRLNEDAITNGEANPLYAACFHEINPGDPIDTGILYRQDHVHLQSCSADGQILIFQAGILRNNQPELSVSILSGVSRDASLHSRMQDGHTIVLTTSSADSIPATTLDALTLTQNAPVDLALQLVPSERPAALSEDFLVTQDLATGAHMIYIAPEDAASSGQDAAVASILLPMTGSSDTLTPSPQDFGSIIVGQTSATQTFTFTNNSGATETVNSVTPGNPTEFPVTGNTCAGSSIAAADTCTITVSFSPSATGARNGTLTVNSTSSISPSVSSSLTGTGLAATTTSTLTPATANFGTISIGNSSSAVPFTLTNTGNTTIGNISVGTSGDYSATPTTCGTTLAPGASCNINVVFTPTALGTRTGTLTISSTSSSTPRTAAFTGTGAPGPGLTLSTYALSMGSWEVGGAFASPVKTVDLTNNDNTAITFTAPPGPNGISFPATGEFVTPNNCNSTLAPGATCQIRVSFTPSTTGTRIGSITIQSSASNGTQTLSLSGNGTDYTMTPAATSVTVKQGQTAVFHIALAPFSGFSDTVRFTCSALTAAGTTCGGPDATLGPAATEDISITTSPKYVGGILPAGLAPNRSWNAKTAWFMSLGSLILLLLAGRTRRLAQAAGLVAVLLVLFLPASGCSGKQPSLNPGATLPGTYSFTVQAVTAQQQFKNLSLTLVVTE